jgi:hypothetical protein
MTRSRRTNRIKNSRSRFHYEPVVPLDGVVIIKGLPVPHISIPDSSRVGPATPKDIANRMEDQLNRYDELKNDQKLTPEWKAFGERHRKE